MVDLDADLKELMIDEMRERAKERAEGRSLAAVLDMLAEFRGELISVRADAAAEVTRVRQELKSMRTESLGRHSHVHARLVAVERRISSAPLPLAPHHRLQSLAEVEPDDSDTLVGYKGQIAPVLEAFRFAGQLKNLAIAVLGIVATGVTIWAALFKK